MEDKIMLTLKAARVNRELSQRDVAEYLGISIDMLKRWESNKSYPPADKFLKLCGLYRIRPDYIFLPVKST